MLSARFPRRSYASQHRRVAQRTRPAQSGLPCCSGVTPVNMHESFAPYETIVTSSPSAPTRPLSRGLLPRVAAWVKSCADHYGPMRRVLGGQENGCASRCLRDPLNPKTAGPSAQGANDFNLEIYRERHAPCRVTRWFFASCSRNTWAKYSERSAPRWCAAGADVRDTREYAAR
jgi:hypothetical protein